MSGADKILRSSHQPLGACIGAGTGMDNCSRGAGNCLRPTHSFAGIEGHHTIGGARVWLVLASDSCSLWAMQTWVADKSRCLGHADRAPRIDDAAFWTPEIEAHRRWVDRSDELQVIGSGMRTSSCVQTRRSNVAQYCTHCSFCFHLQCKRRGFSSGLMVAVVFKLSQQCGARKRSRRARLIKFAFSTQL